MNRYLPVLVLITVLLFALPGRAEMKKRYCKLCKNTGKVPCKIHAEHPDTALCSFRLEFPCGCLGLGWKPCEKGRDIHPEATAAAEKEFEAERAKLEAWLQGRRQIYDLLIFGKDWKKEHCQHFETKHFRLVFTLPGEKIFKIKVSPHQRLHLYALRCEETFSMFAKLMDIPESYQPTTYGKWQVLLWGKVEQELKASHKMVGNTQYPLATGNARLLTICPFSTLDGNPVQENDEWLHHHVVHNIVHLFFEEWGGWVDGCFPMWFYEGTAHWVEYYLFNRVLAHCTDEAGEIIGARPNKWERLVYKMIKDGKDTPLPELTFVKMQDLDFRMRLKGWSLVDWMYRVKGPDKIREFVKVLKKSKNEAKAWRDVFGIRIDEVDELWRKWALERFSPRNLRKLEKENEERAMKFVEHQKELVRSLPR